MGSYDYDTQRTNSAGVGHKNNHAATEVAETEEVKHLKSQYKNDLTTLQELFTDWSEADLLFALQENQGDLELTITRISEGHIAQWGEVKSRKSKKEHSSKNKQSGQQSGNAQRGHQRGGYSDRGRARGEGGRGGRNNDRTRGPRRENGSGYNRPPRQQNGSNHDDASNVTHGKAWGTDNTNSSRNNNNDSIEGNWSNSNNTNEGTSTWATENVTGDWSADITTQGGSWSAENPAENSKGSWTNDSTDKAQSSRSKENPTDSSQPGWSVDNTTENNKDSTDNITASRDIDKSTDNLRHNRDSNITKDNWDTEHSKDNWSVENDSWAADTPKDNWSSDNLGVDTTKSSKIVKEVSKSPNTIMRSVAPTKSPVSHSLRTIPSKPKASWAQIVKPESKPEPKPEPISSSVHKSPETVKPVSPQISKSPNPIQSPPAPKMTESVIVPPQETLTTTIKTEEMKEYVREATSPEVPTATSITSSTPVVNVSPLAKEVSPPGLHKTKTGTATRRLKQDAPVVMPNTGAGLERVGVQFGSLSISNNAEESSETETQVVPQVQKTEEKSPVSVETSPQPQTTPIQQQQQIVPQQTVQQLQQQVSQQQVAQQQATQQLQQQAVQLQQLQQQPPQSAQPQSSTISQSSNSINRLPTTSAQALPSSVGGAPTGTPANAPNPTLQNFNPSYFKQQQDQSSAAYLNQQHHLGLATEPLNAPYASYLPNQPPNQLSGFGIGPIQSIPEYNAMYGPDAQRIMGYYDPSYGQASPVTSTGYQGRENKYTSDTATNTNSQTTNQQSTGTQQSTNQQGGQNPQQQAYPLAGVPYYPYYYMTNQYPSAYQQSGYGQPFVNKSIYPMYNHPHSTKPGSASGSSPYGYPTTPTTPNTPHHYSHTSNTGYDEVTAAQMHHHPGVPSVLDYQKPYSIPPLNFLGNAGANNPQPAGTANSSSTGGKSGNNGSTELNPPTQYKTYQEKTSANTQSSVGVGQTGTQQHQQPTNPNYYGQQQAQQMFNNYQHPQTHHQYYPHQAHHQATNRNQQQFWTSQS